MNERVERALHELAEFYECIIIIGSAYNSDTGETTLETYERGNKFATEGMIREVAEESMFSTAEYTGEAGDGEEEETEG